MSLTCRDTVANVIGYDYVARGMSEGQLEKYNTWLALNKI
jgi:hypothetical protein